MKLNFLSEIFRSVQRDNSQPESLETLRARLLQTILLTILVISTFSWIIPIMASLTNGNWQYFGYYFVAYWWIVFITLFKRATYQIKSTSILAILYAIGILGMLNDNLVSNGRLFLLVFIVLAGLLTDIKKTIIAALVAILSFSILTYIISHGWIPQSVLPAENVPPSMWLISVSTFILLVVICLVPVLIVIRGLEWNIRQHRSLEDTLQQERRTLEEKVKERTNDLEIEVKERRQVENELYISNKFLTAIIEHAPLGISVRNATGKLLAYNQAWKKIWGKTDESILEDMTIERKELVFNNRDVYLSKHQEDVRKIYSQGGILAIPDLKVTNPKPGAARWISQYFYAIMTPDNKVDRVVILTEDITEQKSAEEALRESEIRYRTLVENQGEGIGFINTNEEFVFTNPAAETIFGVGPGELVGRNLREFLSAEELVNVLKETSKRKQGIKSSYEIAINRPDGSRCHILITATPQFDNEGNYLGAFGIFRDITDRKEIEEKLRYLSTHDTLTNLYNRAFFEAELKRLSESRLTPISIIMVDVDGLKRVNDHLGHAAGDALLIHTANILKASFRAEDIVARIGGDEFSILLPQTNEDAVKNALERIQHELAMYNQENPGFPIHLSIGTSTCHQSNILNQCLRLADERMYQEKTSSRMRNLMSNGIKRNDEPEFRADK
ncbi:MAG TPA: diguanylate cyclase [Anaerolineaceae bacterium]